MTFTRRDYVAGLAVVAGFLLLHLEAQLSWGWSLGLGALLGLALRRFLFEPQAPEVPQGRTPMDRVARRRVMQDCRRQLAVLWALGERLIHVQPGFAPQILALCEETEAILQGGEQRPRHLRLLGTLPGCLRMLAESLGRYVLLAPQRQENPALHQSMLATEKLVSTTLAILERLRQGFEENNKLACLAALDTLQALFAADDQSLREH